MAQANAIILIKNYLQALLENNILISKAILYGSYSRNEANDDSDIDLMLISPLFDIDRDKYLGIIWRLTEISEYKIEPYPVGEKRFKEDNISPIIQIAKRDGIEIEI